jgi:hypothetical protein
MKKEFKDLSIEEKKEFLFLQAISIDLPYTIALIPMIILYLITSSVYVGIGSVVMIVCLIVGFIIDFKKLSNLYGLN